MYPRNAASPERIAVGAVVQISDGAVQTSGCTITVRGQGGSEATGGGTTAYGGNGTVYYTPTQAETNFTSFVVEASKSGCIPVAVTIVTTAESTAGTVRVGTNNDKSDYLLTSAYDAAKTASQFDHTSNQVVASNMRGTDGAYTGTPDDAAAIAAAVEAAILDEGDATALLAAIAAKIETFLINDGDATATLAAIAAAVRSNLAVELARIDENVSAAKTLTVAYDASKTASQFNPATDAVNVSGFLGTSITETSAGYIAAAFTKLLDVATPVKDINDIGTATGSGSNHTAEDVAALILTTPANKLVTDASGYVIASNMRGTDGAATSADIAAQTGNLDTLMQGYAIFVNDNTVLVGDALNNAILATPAAVEAAMLNEGDATALLAAIAAKIETFLINDGDATATLAAIAAAVRTNLATELATVVKLDDTLEDDGGVYRFTANALERAPSGGGGGGGEGIYSVTVTCVDSGDNAVSGCRVSVSGLAGSQTTESDGTCVFNLDDGSYTFICSPPPNYVTPDPVVRVVSGSPTTAQFSLEASAGSGVPWVG